MPASADRASRRAAKQRARTRLYEGLHSAGNPARQRKLLTWARKYDLERRFEGWITGKGDPIQARRAAPVHDAAPFNARVPVMHMWRQAAMSIACCDHADCAARD